MADMKLTAEVLLRIEGHDKLHNIGTIDVPINLTFGDKPKLDRKPEYRGDTFTVNIDDSGLTDRINSVAQKASARSL